MLLHNFNEILRFVKYSQKIILYYEIACYILVYYNHLIL